MAKPAYSNTARRPPPAPEKNKENKNIVSDPLYIQSQRVYIWISINTTCTIIFEQCTQMSAVNRRNDSSGYFDGAVEQETQLSLTNRVTHLCKWNSVADLL